jgi:hypothetical protein
MQRLVLSIKSTPVPQALVSALARMSHAVATFRPAILEQTAPLTRTAWRVPELRIPALIAKGRHEPQEPKEAPYE